MRCSRSRFVLSRVIPNTIPSVCWANTEEGKAILAANLPGSTKPRVHLIDGNRAVPSRCSHFPLARWTSGFARSVNRFSNGSRRHIDTRATRRPCANS